MFSAPEINGVGDGGGGGSGVLVSAICYIFLQFACLLSEIKSSSLTSPRPRSVADHNRILYSWTSYPSPVGIFVTVIHV